MHDCLMINLCNIKRLQYYQHATDFWMTIQAECIAFRINNPAKLDTGPHTHNGCIYIHIHSIVQVQH